MHPFTGIRITNKGLKMFQEYAATVRDIVGWDTPIALDHFGHFPLEDCIKIAQALDAGGLLETKKIGDLAMEHGISMALHMAGSPITLYASIHAAAATENFLVMEHHSVDDEWYDKLVDGVDKPIIQNGYINVPDSPGLGVELNEAEVKRHLKGKDKYFAPTDEWNDEKSWDRLWSRRATGKVIPVA